MHVTNNAKNSIDFKAVKVPGAKIKRLATAIDDMRLIREEMGLNQSDFWRLFGITQSGGSRFEQGRSVGSPAQMLWYLFQNKIITKEHLIEAANAVERAGRRRGG